MTTLETKTFTIPCLPPSVNAIYQIIFHQRRVEMKPEVRLWKTKAKEFIPKLTPSADSYLFRVEATFHYDFFHKNGRMRKFDSQNLIKVLCDAIAEKNGIGDEFFKAGSWASTHRTDKEMVEVVVSQYQVAGEVSNEA